MKFGILSQWFDPEPGGGALPGALARELASRGHEVSVLTGFPNYPSGHLYPGYSIRAKLDSWQDGIHIRRVALYPNHDTSASRRILNYGSFALSATTVGLPLFDGLDAIWVYSSPATIAAPMWATKYLLGVPHVLHVMDLWPDSIFLSGFGGNGLSQGLPRRALNKWCSAMYKTASSVAYVTPGLRAELIHRGVPESKLHYVPGWADEEASIISEISPRSIWGVGEEELLILYAGTIGTAQGLDSLIEGLAILRGEVKVICLLAGSGTEVEALERLTQKHALDNVHFLGQIPRDQISGIISAVDLQVVMLRDSPLSSITMPGKIQTILSTGKPFIAAVAGDAQMAAQRSGAAFLATPGNPASIAAAIREAANMSRSELIAKGLRGKQNYQNEYSLDNAVNTLESLLIEAANKGKRKHRN